jgi:glycerophosphoryl diester phosphodiesterase
VTLVYVPCWNCGTETWIETQVECRNCHVPVRRCFDCVNFRTGSNQCVVFNVEVSEHDRLTPGALSLSYKCPKYVVTQEAVQQLRGKAGAKAEAAPTAPAPHRALPEQPKPAQQPHAPAKPRHPIVIGHRGAAGIAPENTVAAVRAGLAAGAQAVEVDVHITKDGHPVAIHDTTLDRTTNGSGQVVDHTLAEIAALDAGVWFGHEHAGERVPTLAQVLDAATPPTWVNIHLRAHENSSDRCEKSVAEAITAAGALERAWVTHNTRHGLHRLRKALPDLRLCWTARGGEADVEYIDDAYYMGYTIIQPVAAVVTPEFIAHAHRLGLWVNASFVPSSEELERLIGLHVDGIFIDDPGRMKAALAKSGS